MPKSGRKVCWRVDELRGVTSWIVSKWGGCGKLISWQVDQLTACELGCYNETEMDLESHRCIVNKQKRAPFPLRKGLWMPCYARLTFV